MLPVHRKRGFITSANSEDTDQLLHQSTIAYSLHLHQQGITGIIQIEPGKCLHCWGVQAELSLLFVHATRHHSVMLNIYLSGNAHLRQTMYGIFFSFLILVKIYERQLGNQVC